MGKSVFLLPSANAAFNRAQIRKLRDTIGNGLLLDGPYSDKNNAVEELADIVRTRVNFGGHKIFDTILALSPKNLPSFLPSSSFLDIPIYLQNNPDDFGFRECAGEFARVSPTLTGGTYVRKLSIDEIVVLAVSVMRSLGTECYFAMIDLENSGKMPAVLIPGTERLNVALLDPAHFQDLSQSHVSYAEVLDQDAVGSLLRIRSTFCMPDLIMESLANGKDLFAKELETYAINAGHLMHEGKSMWTFDDADHALQSAYSMYGPRAAWNLQSLRCVLQIQFVNSMIPGGSMLEELGEGMDRVFEQMDPDMRMPMEILCNFIILMNSHIHPIQGCEKSKEGN